MTSRAEVIADMSLDGISACHALSDVTDAWLVEIFNAATVGGAKALKRDDIGRLDVGSKADLVLVDTQIIAQSPPRLLVAGMGDALATWFEAKTCVDGGVKNLRGGLSTQSALALAKLCYRTLLADGADALRSVQTQVVTPALERLVEANTLLSGIGFESSGLAAAHAIHNGLTTAKATHDYLHGEKVAFGLLTQLVLEGQPRSVLHRVLGFATEVGLPITLADIGLTELPKEVLQKIAVRATAENDTIHNEPFEVRPDMVADAIMAADAMGRAWRKDRSPH